MKRFRYYLLNFITWLSAIAYLFSCFTPIISPVTLWPMAFLALGFPYLAICVILLIVVWFFNKKRIAIYLFILLLCGFQNIGSTLAINIPPSSSVKSKSSLRIMGWNVRNFDNSAIHADSANSVRRRMFTFIQQINPDILCLQDMVEFEGPAFSSNIQALADIGFIYHYIPSEINYYEHYGTVKVSNAIFSKMPLLDSGSVLFNDPSYPEKILYADINFKGKNLRIYTCHFRSINLFSNNPPKPIPLHGDSSFLYTASKFEKLKVFQQEHAMQANIARQFMDASPYPILFAADMNSVPASYAYKKTKGNLQDAFINKGFGLGGSLDSLPRTLRIDYLFAGNEFTIENYHQDKGNLSDHYPHFMDVRWKH